MTWTFLERNYQTYECDFRLFIEGMEVSSWVSESVNLSYAGTGGVGTLSFTLANPENIWTLNEANIAGEWRRVKNSLYSEEAKRDIYLRKKKREDSAKEVIKAAGSTALTDIGVYNLGPQTMIFHRHDCVRLFVRNPFTRKEWWLPAFTGFIDHYPFSDDYIRGAVPINISCYDIKGLMQKMRVAVNPLPTGGGKPSQANVQSASKGASDFLKKEAILGQEAGIFEDLFSAKGLNHAIAGMTFEQTMDFLFFGKGAVGGGNIGGAGIKTSLVDLYGGITSTSLSDRTDVPAKKPNKPSRREQELLDLFDQLNAQPEVRKAGGFQTDGAYANPELMRVAKGLTTKQGGGSTEETRQKLNAAERKAARLAEELQAVQQKNKEEIKIQRPAKGQATGEEEDINPINASAQYPYRRGHVARLTKGQTNKYPGTELEKWHNRCLLGNEEGAYLTYRQVSQLGKGTVLDPYVGSPYNGQVLMLLPAEGLPAKTYEQTDLNHTTDFTQGASFVTRYALVDQTCSQLDFQWFVTPNGDVSIEFPMYDFTPSAFGRYKTAFTVDKHAISSSVEDEAADVPSALVVTATESSAQAAQVTGGQAQAIDPNRVVIYAPLLAARTGAVVEQITAPPSIGGTIGKGSTHGGTSLKGLEAWALLQMQKFVGRSSTLSSPIPWRPFLLPNRPFLHVVRDRMGITQQVQHSLSVGGQCQTTPTLSYVKKKHSDGKYRYPCSGGENLPLNYNTYVTDAGDVTKSGISVRRGVGKGDSQGTQGSPGTYRPSARQRGQKPPILKENERWLPEAQKVPARYQGRLFPAPPTQWVIHCGSGKGNIARYFASLSDGRIVSAHFFFDAKGGITQCVPLDRTAAHEPGANRDGIGSEFEGPAAKTYGEAELNAFITTFNRVRSIYPTIKFVIGHFKFRASRVDPGPRFPWRLLQERLPSDVRSPHFSGASQVTEFQGRSFGADTLSINKRGTIIRTQNQQKKSSTG